jgi:glycosyl transferase family 25
MTLPILILSLPGCDDRLGPLRETLDRLGLPHEVLFGVDARGGLPPEFEPLADRAGARRALGREMQDTEFGCALSHRAAWARVAAGEAPGAIVLEDDARPLPAFAGLARAAPPPCGLLQLFYFPPVRVMRASRLALPGGGEALELAHPAICAVGYWVSRAAAAALVRTATPVRYVADWPCDVTRLGAFVAVPRLVRHAGLDSVIGGERNWRILGIASPKERASRFLTRDYWRRKWRKQRADWLAEQAAPFAPEAPPR